MSLSLSLSVLATQFLDPSREEAQELLREELSKNQYSGARTSVLDIIVHWIETLLDTILDPISGTDVDLGPWLLALLIIVGVLMIFVWLRPRRLGRVGANRHGAVLTDEVLSASEYRQQAEQALADGKFSEAVAQAFRRIVRDAQQRSILDDTPAMTALEAAWDLSVVFPAHESELHWAALTFNDVFYGDQPADAGMVTQMLQLGDALSQERPQGSLGDPNLASTSTRRLVPR